MKYFEKLLSKLGGLGMGRKKEPKDLEPNDDITSEEIADDTDEEVIQTIEEEKEQGEAKDIHPDDKSARRKIEAREDRQKLRQEIDYLSDEDLEDKGKDSSEPDSK